MLLEAREPNIEAVVYFVVSPEDGQGHRVYTEEDIQASGGIHAIERILERDSYWFVRLGEIRGEASLRGFTFNGAEVSKLTIPSEAAWQIGRRNPGFRRPELEQCVFKATFVAFERLLQSWKSEQEGMVDAYALKELNISSECLMSLTNGLCNLRQVHEIAPITVAKYWYDVAWPEPFEPDLVLAEFSIHVPFRAQWSVGQEILDVQVLPLSLC
jgi:hypothetical protein